MSEGSGRFERAFELFDRLCDLADAERQRELEAVARDEPELAAEVARLLELDESGASLERAADEMVAELDSVHGAAVPGTIGEFEVVRVLGEGGMGIVYEALQHHPRRSVALKIIRPGLFSSGQLSRFRREAEVLAWLNHPGIAKVFAAGTADTPAGPQPYIAMELVRGERIDRYVESEGLDRRARLELLAEVCDAIQHAHERGVVHRDLKPANVIVDTESKRPKVLDFGIARITDADVTRMTAGTAVGEILGTLPYMSPEQVNADAASVDARSDVYALGVMAYRILAGVVPLDVEQRSLAEAARIIVHDEPTALGRRDPALRGDVEQIVGKALAKEKDERYLSAHALGDDLRRHLRDEAITARPPTSLEQLRRFARRNRALVAGLGGTFVALLVGAIVATVLLVRTSRLLEERDREVVAANEAITFLEGLFAQTDPIANQDVRLSELARSAASRFDTELRDRPALRARLLDAIAKTFLDLGLPADAAPLLDESLQIRREVNGTNSVEYAKTLERMGRVDELEGRFDPAVEKQREVVRIRMSELGDSVPTANALNNLGLKLMTIGLYDEAEQSMDRAIAMLADLVEDDDPALVASKSHRAAIWTRAGRSREAETLLLQLLPQTREAQRIEVLTDLAWVLRLDERYAEALPYASEAYELSLSRYGSEASVVAHIVGLKGTILTGLGRTREAVDLQRLFRDELIAEAGADSLAVGSATHDLAFAVHDLPVPDCEEALGLYDEARETFARWVGDPSAQTARCDHNSALLLEKLGLVEEAEGLLREVIEVRTDLLGPDDQETLVSLRGLALLLGSAGDLEAAVATHTEYIERASQAVEPGSALVQRARIDVVEWLQRLGRPDDAREVLDDVEAELEQTNEVERERLVEQIAGLRATLGQ
ncbi:MAG: serine/threonine-protein kinase [Planctomycetota bacterium]